MARTIKLFSELQEAGCSLVLRLRQEAVFEELEEFALTAEERAANVTFDGLVRLGRKNKSAPLRLVRLQTQESELWLVCDLPRAELSAELVALQIYCALSAALPLDRLGALSWSKRLLRRANGRRPSKREMEMIRFHQLGCASLEELVAAVTARPARKKSA